jgi:hypothetical protein
MSFPNPTIAIGSASARAEHKADLGKTITVEGKTYRLVKAGAAIAAASGMLLVTALSGGLPTYAVNTSVTAKDPLIVGVVPIGQVGSTGTTGLVSGDYFYIQVSGFAQVKCTAGTVVGDMLGATATAGSAGTTITAAATAFTAGAFAGIAGVALESVAATLAGHVGARLTSTLV